MPYVLPLPVPPSVAIHDVTDRFPLRRIFCVGRNYAAHAREMGKDPEREAPFFFMKPADTAVDAGARIPYPPQTSELHHEIELAVAIGLGGEKIAEDQALNHVWGYGIGLDLTRRDLQAEAKRLGRPWDWAKGFDRSAVLAPLRHVSQIGGHPTAGRIALEVNGAARQEGDLREMIWSVPEIIAAISASMALAPGDLILTGTPAGVGPLQKGDHCLARIEGLGELQLSVAL